MKSFLLLCLLACGLRAVGQVSPQAPVKNANVVLVQTPDSAAVALRKLATVFVAQGYTVDKLDREFLTLTLVPKLAPHPKGPVLAVRASATAGGASTLRLSGDYKVTIANMPLNLPAEYTGNNQGCSVTCFRELQNAGTAYPAGKVSYAKQ